MLKLCSGFIVVAVAIVAGMPATAQQKGPVSPHDKVGTMIGGARVTIYYGRPYTKDPKSGAMRKIWGGLVPWDKAWRAGADEATTIITTDPMMLGDTMIPAGAHTLYMLPSEKGTTKLAVTTKIGQWGIKFDGTGVDEGGTFAKIDMTKGTLDKQLDQFTIAIAAKKGEPKGELKMMWETTQFSVPISKK